MSVLVKKSILARLLARENITVEHTNHHTAFFDVERRILGLPQWKDVDKDLYDLLVGHEIGHALHTPAEGWHESTTQIPGCPRSYVNIVEDIRIEKLVLREFPGLLGSFMRGYQDLLNRDFFGIKNEDVNKLSFMNRLNIFAKSRGLVTVRFSSKEQPYVDRAMAVETWDDVMDSCRELYAFMKAELEAERKAQEDAMKALKELSLKPAQGIPEKIIIKAGDKKEDKEKPEPMSDELKEAIKNGEVEIEVDLESFEKAAEEEQEEEQEEETPEPEEDEDLITVGAGGVDGVETDAIFRAAIAQALVDSIGTGGSTLYAKGPTKAQADAVTRSFEEVKKSRWRQVNSSDFPEKRYVRFLSDTKDSVAVMVKEFEMRKTARRFARARTSTKGSLDVNSLHKYKYEDNIFKQVTHLDDDQSHGMMMLIDYSQSMSTILPKVIKQLLILVTFCKRVNIPFEVYGFTSPSAYNDKIRKINQTLTAVSMHNCHVFKLIDSSMSKKVYEEAFKGLFAQTGNGRRNWMGSMESMGGTPLDASILVMYHHIAAFRAKHNVQKMNFITLTDGESEGIGITTGIDAKSSNGAKKRVIEVNGTKIVMRNYGRGTADILQGLRDQGVRTMNYHLITPGELKYRVSSSTAEEAEAAMAVLKKDGCFIVDNANGYDRQILTSLSGDNSSSKSDDDEDEELDANTKNLAEAFQNKALKKKRNRLVAAKFAEIVS
jgi:hypothetical protein